MDNFVKEITYLGQRYDVETSSWVDDEVTKNATFKELDRKDRSQHQLHFLSQYLIDKSVKADGEGKATVEFNSDEILKATIKFISVCHVVTPEFDEKQKELFLNDGVALYNFGMWLLNAKIIPFWQASIGKRLK